jgi:hypothetical protein
MNKNLIIPEYLVEFDYVMKETLDNRITMIGN